MNLTDLYDADRRTRDPIVRDLAGRYPIPHPLHGVPYADSANECTHARRCPMAGGWLATVRTRR